MSLATLSVDLVAKLAGLEEGMSRATRIAEKNAAAIEARYAKIGNAVRTVASVIGGAFAGVTLAQFVRATVNGLDALNDLKDATGASIENLSALEDVALRTGTSFEGMATTLVKFNKILSEAKVGSETANILKSIGLNAEELKKIDPAEALRRTAVALDRFANDGNKARIVQALFAKSIAEAGPYLNELAKQGELNATVTTAQAEAAEKFNQQLSSLQKNISDVARSLLSQMLPAMNEILATLTQKGLLAALDKLGNVTFDWDRQQIRKQIAPIEFEIKTAQERLANMSDGFRKGGAPTLSDAINASLFGGPGELEAKIMAGTAKVEQLRSAMYAGARRPANEGGGKFLGLPAPDVGGIVADKKGAPAQISEAQRALAAYVGQLEREREKIADLSDEEKALNFLKEIGTTGQIPQVRELVLGMAAQNDQQRDNEAMTILQAKAWADLASQQEKSLETLQQWVDNSPTDKLEEQRRVMGQLVQQYEAGKFGLVGSAEAMARFNEIAQTGLGTLPEQWKNATDRMNEFTMQAARNIQDALGDTVLATLQGNFESIGRLWGSLIERMIAQALGARLGELLLGDFAKSGVIGGGLGALFSMFGFAKGGAFQGGVQTFAQGGIVGSPTLFKFAGGAGLMGEAGPEAIMPLKRGRDGKLGVAGGGGGGGGVTIVNNVQAGVSRNEVMTALQMAMASLRGEFKQTLRNAGVA